MDNQNTTGGDGPEPLPDTGGWPHFREDSLFESAVIEAARELEVSREMAMMCAFGAMATVCQSHVDVQMPSGHQVPTSLMLLTIAESGERKTTTQNYFFGAIKALNDAAHKASDVALLEYRVKHQIWQVHKRHLERMYSKFAAQEDESMVDSALRSIEDHLRAEPQPARSGKFLYEDTTPQALVRVLYENTRNGCLLTSEANSIFSGKALGELDKLNTLWDGSSVIVDRVSRESFILQDARLTLALMAQPSVITRFMEKRGDEARGTGFLARFMIVKPYTMAGERKDIHSPSMKRQRDFNDRILERLKAPAPHTRQLLHFSEKAKNRWYELNQYLEREMRPNRLYYYLKDHASKLLENTTRLAAILHTFERKSDNDVEIQFDTLEFCWEYVQACSQHFIKHLANEPQLIKDTNQLANYLLKISYEDKGAVRNKANRISVYPSPRRECLVAGERATFTLTDAKRYGPSSLRGRANADRLAAAIELLTKLGHVVKNGGRYNFQESILLKDGEPELKNGQIVTIKDLPLFNEQEYWSYELAKGRMNLVGYYIKVKK